MSKNFLTSLAVAALIVGGLVLVARGRSNQATNPPAAAKLVAQHLTYDFGRISMAAGVVRHTFPVRNASGGEININQMYTSCMCTVASLEAGGEKYGPFGMPGHGMMQQINRMMGAGEEATVEVEFDPAAHGPAGVGKVSRDVIVETDDGAVTLSIAAEVVP